MLGPGTGATGTGGILDASRSCFQSINISDIWGCVLVLMTLQKSLVMYYCWVDIVDMFKIISEPVDNVQLDWRGRMIGTE